jgi:hypothetical protein
MTNHVDRPVRSGLTIGHGNGYAATGPCPAAHAYNKWDRSRHHWASKGRVPRAIEEAAKRAGSSSSANDDV